MSKLDATKRHFRVNNPLVRARLAKLVEFDAEELGMLGDLLLGLPLPILGQVKNQMFVLIARVGLGHNGCLFAVDDCTYLGDLCLAYFDGFFDGFCG